MEDAVEGRRPERPLRWPVIEASVRAGGVETPYRRAGGGRTVLLLLDPGYGDAWAVEVFEALRGRARVVRPELVGSVWRPGPTPRGSGTLVAPERWLRELVEGLGLDRPVAVLDDRTRAALGDLLARDGDRFGGWIVLAPGTLPDPAALDPLLETDAD